MKRLFLLTLLTPLFLMTGSFRAEAACVDYFLKIDGIDGESTDSRAPGTIEVLSWSWGETNDSVSGTNQIKLAEFNVEARMNKQSPKLMFACATGVHIPEATLYVFVTEDSADPSEAQPYYQWELTDVYITSYQTSGSSSERPTEEIAFYYNKATFQYRGDDGEVIEGEVTRSRETQR